MQKDEVWSELLVLVIDDSRVARAIIRNLLVMVGITRIVEADSAEVGLMMVRDRMPDLVLLDWVMPGLSGDEFLVSLRSDPSPELKFTPTLVVTAEASKRNVIRAARLGANGVICKPCSATILRQRISHLIENRFALPTPPLLQPPRNYTVLPPVPPVIPPRAQSYTSDRTPSRNWKEPLKEETIMLF